MILALREASPAHEPARLLVAPPAGNAGPRARIVDEFEPMPERDAEPSRPVQREPVLT